MNAAFLLALTFGTAGAAAQDLPPIRSQLFAGQEHHFLAHPFDQQHVRLNVLVDPANRTVSGSATLHVRPLEPLRSITLMAADMEIDSIIVELADAAFPVDFRFGSADSLIIDLTQRPTVVPRNARDVDETTTDTSESALSDTTLTPRAGLPGEDSQDHPPVEDSFAVTTYYRAQPTAGLYFVPPYDDEPARTVQIWSQGEPELHHHWFPIYDRPGDKLTSELIVTIDSTYTVVSNGALEAQWSNGDGTRTFHYVQNQPHAPYLITLAADDFVVSRDHVVLPEGRRVPMANWSVPHRALDVDRTLGGTSDMMLFFSEVLGVSYPWMKYDQVFVRDFHWGGMENTGATTLTDRVLVDDRAQLDYNPDRLVAHELAHQWFGNLVTPNHWSHIWLNEGFATFMAARYLEYSRGREAYLLQLQRSQTGYFTEARHYVRPLVWNRWVDPINMFDRHSFDKGALVLHMLRSLVGDDVFSEILETYLERHAYGSVETADLQRVVEEVTGHAYDGFFDQWVFRAGHPVIDLTYQYDPDARVTRVSVRQVQQGDLVPSAFSFPLTLEVQTLAGATRHDVTVSQRTHEFSLESAMPPRFVLPDPDFQLLAAFHVDQPASAWIAQLRSALEPVSRIHAARALAHFVDEPALLVGLRTAFAAERVPQVRTEIVKIFGLLPESQAREQAILAATGDAAATVRLEAVRALAGLTGSQAAIERALEAAHSDPSYSTQAAAVVTLARLGAPNALDVIRSALITPSFREVVRRAAFDALPYVDLPAQESLRLASAYGAPGQPTEARTGAIRYLGYLAQRHERALELLLDFVDDDSYRVRQSVVDALGTIPSPSAYDALQTRMAYEPEARLRQRIFEIIQRWTQAHES